MVFIKFYLLFIYIPVLENRDPPAHTGTTKFVKSGYLFDPGSQAFFSPMGKFTGRKRTPDKRVTSSNRHINVKNFKGKKPNMKIYINSVGGGIRTFKT